MSTATEDNKPEEYFLAEAGNQQYIGPMSLEQIRSGLKDGSIPADYLYCTEQMEAWQPLSTLAELHKQKTPGAPQPKRLNIPPAPVPGGINPYTGTLIPPVRPMPENHMVMSIIGICIGFFCCLPSCICGVVALIKSFNVETYWRVGKYEEAIKASASAKSWGTISLLIPLVFIIFLCIASVG